jgi:hypothetical protein
MAAPDQPDYYSDHIDPVSRSSPEQLFLLMLEAKPQPDSDEYREVGGAYVNCWVDADDLRTAERRAVALILEEGWKPYRFESWQFVTRETYVDQKPDDSGSADMREVVDEAFADGVALVFNTWGVDAPDADEGD